MLLQLKKETKQKPKDSPGTSYIGFKKLPKINTARITHEVDMQFYQNVQQFLSTLNPLDWCTMNNMNILSSTTDKSVSAH